MAALTPPFASKMLLVIVVMSSSVPSIKIVWRGGAGFARALAATAGALAGAPVFRAIVAKVVFASGAGERGWSWAWGGGRKGHG